MREETVIDTKCDFPIACPAQSNEILLHSFSVRSASLRLEFEAIAHLSKDLTRIVEVKTPEGQAVVE
jgi:hypothetical protein